MHRRAIIATTRLQRNIQISSIVHGDLSTSQRFIRLSPCSLTIELLRVLAT